jgi:hypothetical protein
VRDDVRVHEGEKSKQQQHEARPAEEEERIARQTVAHQLLVQLLLRLGHGLLHVARVAGLVQAVLRNHRLEEPLDRDLGLAVIDPRVSE